MEYVKNLIEQDDVDIEASENTLENCYDITLVNEDYTLGNILNYELYTQFFLDLKALDYVGFKKLHPHDSDSILRMSLTDKTKGVSTVKTMLIASIDSAINKVQNLKGCFDGSRKV